MLKAEISVPVSLAAAGGVLAIYYNALPTLADARAVEPNNTDMARAERQALLLSVGLAGGVALLARDSTPFVVGALTAVALSWLYRHANQLNSTTQTIWNRDQYTARRYDVQAS